MHLTSIRLFSDLFGVRKLSPNEFVYVLCTLVAKKAAVKAIKAITNLRRQLKDYKIGSFPKSKNFGPKPIYINRKQAQRMPKTLKYTWILAYLGLAFIVPSILDQF